jgi:hypothetical protein
MQSRAIESLVIQPAEVLGYKQPTVSTEPSGLYCPEEAKMGTTCSKKTCSYYKTHTNAHSLDGAFERLESQPNIEEDFWAEQSQVSISAEEERIPGINLYLANAATEVLIENGIFPLVGTLPTGKCGACS